MPIAARQLVFKALAELGEVLGSRPEMRPRFQTDSDCCWRANIQASRSPQNAESRRSFRKYQSRRHRTSAEQTKLLQSPESGPADDAVGCRCRAACRFAYEADSIVKSDLRPAENILRVDAERIDNLLNLVGELIIGKSMLQQTLNEFSRQYPKDPMRGRFADAMAFQSRVLNDLQRSVMKVRMVPVEQLFRRFPRMVRDVAQAVRQGRRTRA